MLTGDTDNTIKMLEKAIKAIKEGNCNSICIVFTTSNTELNATIDGHPEVEAIIEMLLLDRRQKSLANLKAELGS